MYDIVTPGWRIIHSLVIVGDIIYLITTDLKRK